MSALLLQALGSASQSAPLQATRPRISLLCDASCSQNFPCSHWSRSMFLTCLDYQDSCGGFRGCCSWALGCGPQTTNQLNSQDELGWLFGTLPIFLIWVSKGPYLEKEKQQQQQQKLFFRGLKANPVKPGNHLLSDGVRKQPSEFLTPDKKSSAAGTPKPETLNPKP